MNAGNGVHARLTELERRMAVVEDRTERGMMAIERFEGLRTDLVKFQGDLTARLDETRKLTWRVGLAIVIAAATGIATDLVGLV